MSAQAERLLKKAWEEKQMAAASAQARWFMLIAWVNFLALVDVHVFRWVEFSWRMSAPMMVIALVVAVVASFAVSGQAGKLK